MGEFRKRRSRRQEILRFIAGLGGALLLGVFAYFAAHAAWDMYGKFVAAADADRTTQLELASLQEQKAQTSAAVERLQSQRGVEGELRQRYGVAKPGEGEIVVVRAQASTSVSSGVPSENLFALILHALLPF